MKNLLKSDLKHFYNALVKVYPIAFRRIIMHWQITLLILFLIFSAFYFDSEIQSVFTNLHFYFADLIFAFGRWYGSGLPTLYFFLIAYLAGLIFKMNKLRQTGLLVFEAYIFSGLVTLIFKSAFGRFRPYTNQGDLAFYGWNWSDNDMFSYFSGHAAVSFALSVILASATENYYLKSFYYLLAVITCLSRIYHNQHWFSDVLSGAVSAYFISKILIDIHKEPKTDY